MDKNYDFDAVVATQKLLYFKDEKNKIIKILFKTQASIFQYNRKVSKSQEEFHSIVGEYRPNYYDKTVFQIQNIATFVNYFLINLDDFDIIKVCLNCDHLRIIAIGINIFPEIDLNNFVYKRYLTKLIYYYEYPMSIDSGGNMCRYSHLNNGDLLIEVYCSKISKMNITYIRGVHKSNINWHGKTKVFKKESFRQYYLG